MEEIKCCRTQCMRHNKCNISIERRRWYYIETAALGTCSILKITSYLCQNAPIELGWMEWIWNSLVCAKVPYFIVIAFAFCFGLKVQIELVYVIAISQTWHIWTRLQLRTLECLQLSNTTKEFSMSIWCMQNAFTLAPIILGWYVETELFLESIQAVTSACLVMHHCEAGCVHKYWMKCSAESMVASQLNEASSILKPSCSHAYNANAFYEISYYMQSVTEP